MTRDELEARVWRSALDLRGPGAGKAMDAILRAAHAYAVTEAGQVLVDYARQQAAKAFPHDPPMVTAERRRELEDALRGDPRTIRAKEAA